LSEFLKGSPEMSDKSEEDEAVPMEVDGDEATKSADCQYILHAVLVRIVIGKDEISWQLSSE
jgi:hypothetical protein